jgi:phospholipid/cholesterol/gamma-HCH transport system permease protein
MGTMSALRGTYPKVVDQLGRPVSWLGSIGDHILFYGRALAGTPHAAVHFRREIIRLVAEIAMGAGTLAMIGGTVVIVGFLTLAAGGTLAVQGYSSLGNIGIEALTGFLAAFINVRISAPVVAGIGLAAKFGAGVTAQLGAMRINEEIDALESMGIPPVEYLVSTRIVAGMIAITPLYSIAVILSFVASKFTTVVLFGQSGGLYNDYFTTFLNPIDLLWSFLQAILMAVTILFIHTYYGYFASGGPSGGRGGRQRGAHLAGGGGQCDPADLVVHLRRQRQLQPVGIGERSR